MKTKINTLIVLFFLCIPILAQQEDEKQNNTLFQKNGTRSVDSILPENNFAGNSGKFADPRDGHNYRWVRIDKQIWMAENLAWLPDEIPPTNNTGYQVFSDKKNRDKPLRQLTYYQDYGVIYQYDVALNACPPGWRMPLDYDWLKLESFLGINKDQLMLEGPRGEHGNLLKADSIWECYLPEINNTGFSAKPSGYYDNKKRSFFEIGKSTTFWSVEVNKNTIWCRTLMIKKVKIERFKAPKQHAYSLRCIKE